MIRRIISGAQDGVELAAMDVAEKLGISLGGWIPKGLRHDDPFHVQKYRLREANAAGYHEAIERNVLDADGTLIISCGKKNEESRYAVQMSLKHQKQLLHIDLRQSPAFEAASLIHSWTAMQRVATAFITGCRDDDEQSIYHSTLKILETVFYLGFVKTGVNGNPEADGQDDPPDQHKDYPKTIEQAVQQLKGVLPLKDRILMANMQFDEIEHLSSGLGEYMKQNFGFYAGNSELLDSCARYGQLLKPLIDDACNMILLALWKDLKNTHRLRIIK